MKRRYFLFLALLPLLYWPFSSKKLDFKNLALEDLKKMEEAGNSLESLYRQNPHQEIFGSILPSWTRLDENIHYPKKDVINKESCSQYYYHSHRKGEHGHFHIFLREKGFPDHIERKNLKGFVQLVAISLDRSGYPSRLFLTNQWVTNEETRSQHELNELLPYFKLDTSNLTNAWIESMLVLFKPQIQKLWEKREAFFKSSLKDQEEMLKDRSIEILAEEKISLSKQLKAVREALN